MILNQVAVVLLSNIFYFRLNTSYPGNLSSGWNYIHQCNMSSEIELMPAVDIHITCCSDIR